LYSFISTTSPAISEEEFIKCIKRTGKICKENNSKLILGGRYLQKFDKTLTFYAIAYSLKEAKSFIKTKTK